MLIIVKTFNVNVQKPDGYGGSKNTKPSLFSSKTNFVLALVNLQIKTKTYQGEK